MKHTSLKWKLSIRTTTDFRHVIQIYIYIYYIYILQNFVHIWKNTIGSTKHTSGPSCSKLTTSLVNDSLKFTSSDTQICWNFLLKKNVSSFCSAKATHIFPAKNIIILCIESAETVNEMTLNELVKLTTLWTTGPWSITTADQSVTYWIQYLQAN